jgi:hypothetical protein
MADPRPKRQPLIVSVVAVGLIIVFIGSLGLMISLRDEPNWDRLVYLLGGLEPLVYAGAGALFGTTVARADAEAARQDAQTARAEAAQTKASAAEAEKDAAALRAVRAAVEVKRQRDRGERGVQGAKPGLEEPMSDLDELAELIERLSL